jgi:hypothetical protein
MKIKPVKPGLRCADCGEWITEAYPFGMALERSWFTCSTCGKTICENCRKAHISLCMVLTWRMATVDPDTGKLIQSAKPHKFTMG